MSVAIPPRYLFHVRVSVECGVYARNFPSALTVGFAPYGVGNSVGSPPSAETAKICGARGYVPIPVALNKIRPSLIQSAGVSADG